MNYQDGLDGWEIVCGMNYQDGLGGQEIEKSLVLIGNEICDVRDNVMYRLTG